MTNSNLQGRSSREVKNVLKGPGAISALKFGLSLVFFTVFLVACPQPTPSPTPTPGTTLLPGITLSAARIMVEEGDEGMYTVRLNTEPTATVTINVMEMEDSPAISLSSSSTSLMFSMDNWNTPQTVIVEAVEENSNYGDDVVPINHSVVSTVGGYTTELTLPSVVVTTNDNDIPVRISETEITPDEGDTEGTTYTVALLTVPTDEVTINVMEDSDAIEVSPSTLTFTTDPGNYNAGQPVTVRAVADDDNISEMVTITHRVATTVGIYTADLSIPNVEVTALDDELGVRISETAITAVEGGAASTYTVALQTAPTSGVVTINVMEMEDNPTITVSPSMLMFSTSTWNTPQTVSVTAMIDGSDNIGETTTITHAVNADVGGYTTGLTIPNVVVTVTEDVPGIVIVRGLPRRKSTRTSPGCHRRLFDTAAHCSHSSGQGHSWGYRYRLPE